MLCYLELKLRYLINQWLFLIKVIISASGFGNDDNVINKQCVFSLFGSIFLEKSIWVTLGDFTVKTQSIWKICVSKSSK